MEGGLFAAAKLFRLDSMLPFGHIGGGISEWREVVSVFKKRTCVKTATVGGDNGPVVANGEIHAPFRDSWCPAMHVRELVETSCWVADHAPSFIAFSAPVAMEQIETYWAASRCRLDRWTYALKNLAAWGGVGTSLFLGQRRADRQPLIEEILISEVLTRVWTAVATAHDRRRKHSELSPVCRSIYLGHLEARNRALQLLVNHNFTALEEAVALNRLRRRCERWTDLLLSRIAGFTEVGDLAFDMDRVSDFQREIGADSTAPNAGFAWKLVLGSIRASFASGLANRSPCEDLNAKIASSILACLSSEMFDATGMLKSHWIHRIERVSADTQGMIEDLLRAEREGGTAPLPPEADPRKYRSDGPHPPSQPRFRQH